MPCNNTSNCGWKKLPRDLEIKYSLFSTIEKVINNNWGLIFDLRQLEISSYFEYAFIDIGAELLIASKPVLKYIPSHIVCELKAFEFQIELLASSFAERVSWRFENDAEWSISNFNNRQRTLASAKKCNS